MNREMKPKINPGVDTKKTLCQKRLELIAGLVAVIIAVFWFVIFVDRVLMPLIVSAGVEHEVPDFHYMQLAEADSICSLLDIELVLERTRIDDRVSPGTILDQYPVAGVKVKPGRRLEIVVSAGEGLVICPDIIGRSPREAAITADSVGLTVDSKHTRYRHTTKYPEGVVMFQTPEPKTEMNRSDELVLIVSLGKRPTEIVAPDLVGRQFENVGIMLAKYNLRLGRVKRFPDRSVPAGTVLSQDPLPGTPMKARGKVHLDVAVKPASFSTPDTTRDTTVIQKTEVD